MKYKLVDTLCAAIIIAVAATLFAFAFMGAAGAQITYDQMDHSSGWARYTWSDGTTGYSMPMGDGLRRYSFSDGTTGYRQDWQTPDSDRYNHRRELKQNDWWYK